MTLTRRAALLPWAAAPFSLAAGRWTDLTEWKANAPGSWRFEGGEIHAGGPPSHLFYNAPGAERIKNFELELEVMTRPGANSGVYFHTAYQPDGFPKQGFEVQINNTAGGEGAYRERKRTGSLYGLRNVYKALARDNEWFRLHVAVAANHVQVRVNGLLTVDYIEPKPPVMPPSQETARFLQTGTFALQCHDPGSKVRFRNLRFRRLPDDLPALPAPLADDTFKRIIQLGVKNYPLIDYHVHLHEGLDIPGLLDRSRRDGLTYGLSVNAGRQSRARTDRDLLAFAEAAAGLPSFTGLQAEGGDWTRVFTPDACRRFDYIFNDGLIWTGDKGEWTRLYRPDETATLLRDPEAFMNEYVNRLAAMIATQPIDLWAIPTWLPPSLEARRAELWTAPRVQRLIDLAARHQVAIEISDRYQIPNAAFIRQAKQAGVKLALGTGNSSAQDLRRSDYGLRMIEECGLAWNDIYLPGAFGEIAIHRRAHLIE